MSLWRESPWPEPRVFEVLIEPWSGRFRSRVVAGASGGGEHRFTLPGAVWTVAELRRRQSELRGLALPAPPEAAGALRSDALSLGRALFDAAFGGPVGSELRESMAKAAGEHRPLAIHLRLADDARLWGLPWETLTDPRTGQPFAISAETPLVRRIEAAAADRRPLARKARVVVGVACPAALPKLDAAREMSEIQDVGRRLLGRALVVEALAPLTVLALRRRVRKGAFEIFHLSGHGDIDPVSGESCLLFEDGEGAPCPTDGGRLAAALDPPDEPQRAKLLPRLVVLNACEGARCSDLEALGGVAQRLIRHGVPAVVAMRAAVADSSAIELARVFYRELAAGRSVEVALAVARKALYKEAGGADWALPVLVASGPAGPLVKERPRWRWGRIAAACSALLFASAAASLFLALSKEPPAPGGIQHFAQPPSLEVDPELLLADDPGCPSPPGVRLGLVRIGEGAFLMGSTEKKEERPQREAVIQEPFCLGRTEVTEAQWDAVVGDGGGRSVSGVEQSPMPKTKVNWLGAQRFIARLNELAGSDVFFLPTDVQWEYAARAGSTGRYHFGDDERDLHIHGNCRNDKADGYEFLAPVARFRANTWGLYDMHGNAAEWVRALPDGEGSKAAAQRRGGSYLNSPEKCRSTSRVDGESNQHRPEFGLRVARKVAPGTGAP